MAKIEIPFGGMTNIPDANVSRDGDMQLLVNMRHRGGELVQMERPEESAISGVKALYKHVAADKLLGISNDGKRIIDMADGSSLPIGSPTYVDMKESAGVVPEPSDTVLYTYDGYGTLYTNGVLVLDGKELDFQNDYAPWRDKGRKNIRYARIVNYTKVGYNVFYGCENLSVVELNAVSEIRGSAFSGCNSLTKVYISSIVTYIDATAFDSNVEYVYYGGTNVKMVQEAFRLSQIYVIDESLVEDGVELFKPELTSYEFSDVIDSLIIFGNVLGLVCKDVNYYARWTGEDYLYLGELPMPPSVRFKPTLRKAKVVTAVGYFPAVIGDATIASNPMVTWEYAAVGYYDAVLEQLYANGCIIDAALYRVGVRLFDGSYIVSPLFYIEDKEDNITITQDEFSVTLGRGVDNFKDKALTITVTSNQQTPYVACIRGLEVECIFDPYDFSGWEDIIASVDVFTSGSIMRHERKEGRSSRRDRMDNDVLYSFGAYPGAFWEERTIEDYNRNVIEAMAMMYRIASYDLKGNLIKRVDKLSPSNLAVQERLENIISPHNMRGENNLKYNSRLHFGGCNKAYYKGYKEYVAQLPSDANKTDKITSYSDGYAVVTLNNDSGESRVRADIKDFEVISRSVENSQVKYIQPLITYPDADATKIEFYLKDGDNKGYKIEYPLQKHEILDMAYHLNTEVVITGPDILGAAQFSQNGVKYSFARTAIDVEVLRSKIRSYFEYLNDGVTMPNDSVVPDGEESITYFIERDSTIYAQPTIMLNNKKIFNKLIYLGDFVPSEWGLSRTGVLNLSADYMITFSFHKQEAGTAEGGLAEIPILQNATEWDGSVPEERNAVVELKDALYVSDVDNPWHFPATYKFDGDILGVASSAEEVSSGQFGQYPLYVFTTEGVWAMGVDTSGKGVYLSQTPISREVCNGEICPITGGVVFSTDRGIMVINGSQVTNISSVLDGEFGECDNLIRQIAGLAELDAPAPVRFRDYIKDCVIAYDYTHNEVIVSNAGVGYSYVYSVTNGKWSIIDRVYKKKVNAYPELLMYDQERIYKFVDNVKSVPVFYITRPIKVGATNRKRIIEAALRGTWEGSVYFYVLGSNDGVRWALLGGKEHKESTKHRDLVASCQRSKSYKYIAFGVASPDFKGSLSMIEASVDAGIDNNKLL